MFRMLLKMYTIYRRSTEDLQKIYKEYRILIETNEVDNLTKFDCFENVNLFTKFFIFNNSQIELRNQVCKDRLIELLTILKINDD